MEPEILCHFMNRKSLNLTNLLNPKMHASKNEQLKCMTNLGPISTNSVLMNLVIPLRYAKIYYFIINNNQMNVINLLNRKNKFYNRFCNCKLMQ